jgi:putative peptidoglycan lipid II flippase
VTVFSPGGQEPDNPTQASLAIDGNTTTVWATDTYKDREPFPAFKSGVGLLLHLPKPAVLSAVNVTVNSTGTALQIRSASSDSPTSLSDTTELSAPKPMQQGANTIPINNAQPTQNVLVFITTLGNTGGDYHAELAEITLQAKS